MRNDNLANLLNSLTEASIYVIEEKTHQLLYFNQRCQDTSREGIALGVKCHEVWPELCANCPLDTMQNNASAHLVKYDPLLKTTVDITANRIVWNDQIDAIVVTAIPHRLNFEEEQGLRKIKQMYAQSLATIFDECVIVNLTANFYINCGKDVVLTSISEQGNFAKKNEAYAKKALHPNDYEQYQKHFSYEALLGMFEEGKKQKTKRLRRLAADDTYHMMEFTAAKMEQLEGEECWCVLVSRDIQEEYLLEQQRNMEISQLATAAKVAYQMLIAVNLTQNTYHMLEYERVPVKRPPDEGRFDDLIEFEYSTVHPDYQEEFIRKFSRHSLVEAFTNGQRIMTMEIPHLGQDGIYHWNFTQVVPVESPYTDDLIEITLSRNIDEERRLQEETLEKERQAKQLLEDALQKAEKANKAKSDFLSKMSHDIRTPMNAIVGMTELARIHIGEKEKMSDYLQKIANSGAHLLGLINEVLDVSKIESGAIELDENEFDLCELMRQGVEMVRHLMENKQQKLTVKIDEEAHVQVLGDVRRLKQVLVNILENASKYTEKGGTILFTLEELKKKEKKVGTYQFIIEDSGIGMKPDYLKHIFEPFSRADDSRISKVAGTGLGMTIVKNLITMMGGNIQVQSEYGEGSRFIITLCLTKCDSCNVTKSVKPQWITEDFSELRILLVEDNELNRQIAQEMLELFHVQVEVAEDGQQAVEAVCAHPPFYYDMIFMDIQMPVLNGYKATKQIRHSGMERIDELPIIAMTADAFAEDIKQARFAGMNGHLAKPISMEQLKNALIHCLDWKRQNRHPSCTVKDECPFIMKEIL